MANPENFPEFRHVTVHRPGPHLSMVRWAIAPTGWDLDDIAYTIYRSESPAGPWDDLGEVEPGRYHFYDHDVVSPGTGRYYYYIVRLVSRLGRGYLDSTPVRLEHDPDHIALEHVRKKNLYLKVKGGVEVAVFQRKSWGPRCSRCHNAERDDVTDPDCHECLGTGIAGGYLNPVIVPALANMPEKMVVRSGVPYEMGMTMFEIANQPLVGDGDLMVDLRANIRYRVKRVHQNSHRGYVVSQIVTLLRSDDNDVIYSLDVPEAAHAPYGRSWDLVKRNDDAPPFPDLRPSNSTR